MSSHADISSDSKDAETVPRQLSLPLIQHEKPVLTQLLMTPPVGATERSDLRRLLAPLSDDRTEEPSKDVPDLPDFKFPSSTMIKRTHSAGTMKLSEYGSTSRRRRKKEKRKGKGKRVYRDAKVRSKVAEPIILPRSSSCPCAGGLDLESPTSSHSRALWDIYPAELPGLRYSLSPPDSPLYSDTSDEDRWSPIIDEHKKPDDSCLTSRMILVDSEHQMNHFERVFLVVRHWFRRCFECTQPSLMMRFYNEWMSSEDTSSDDNNNGVYSKVHSYSNWVNYPKLTERSPFFCDHTILSGHKGWVMAVVVTTDGRYAYTGSADRSIIRWDLSQNARINQWKAHKDFVRCLDWNSRSKSLVSGSHDRTIKIWDGYTNELKHTLLGHVDFVYSVKFNDKGKLIISASTDRTLRLWSVKNGECLRILSGHSHWINNAIFVKDDYTHDLLFSSVRKKIYKNSELKQKSVTPNGCRSKERTLVVSCSWDKSLRIWDAHYAECIRSLKVSKKQPVYHLCLSCDSAWMAIVREKSIMLYQWPEMEHDRTIKDYCFNACFHPLKPHVLCVVRNKISSLKLYDVRNGHSLCTLEGHSRENRQAYFTPDGTRLLSVSQDRTVRIWDVTNL